MSHANAVTLMTAGTILAAGSLTAGWWMEPTRQAIGSAMAGMLAGYMLTLGVLVLVWAGSTSAIIGRPLLQAQWPRTRGKGQR